MRGFVRTDGYSEAFLGGLLIGVELMRYVFMDEAGTSAVEPVSVVVGLIADADNHVMTGEALALEVLKLLPAVVRQDFVFHATNVFAGGKHRDLWSFNDRLAFLKFMMSIPRRVGMAICLGVHWRGAVDWSKESTPTTLTDAQTDHYLAFINCVGVADRSIRRHAGPREVATIVAEDIPEMRKQLKWGLHWLREQGIHLSPDHLRTTVADEEAGYLVQSGSLQVSRIRKAIHFVEKPDDPMVQVADACAYGFRRYFAGEKFGDDFAQAIMGDLSYLRMFAPPGGAECFWPLENGFR